MDFIPSIFHLKFQLPENILLSRRSPLLTLTANSDLNTAQHTRLTCGPTLVSLPIARYANTGNLAVALFAVSTFRSLYFLSFLNGHLQSRNP
jgi:hypothetical protein